LKVCSCWSEAHSMVCGPRLAVACARIDRLRFFGKLPPMSGGE
jgi:hypothetical protein